MDQHLTANGYSAAHTIAETASQLEHFEQKNSSEPLTVLPNLVPPLGTTTLPEHPATTDTTASWLLEHIAPHLNRASLLPNYYGFVIGGATPAALSADVLASYFDQNVHVHLPNETIATTVEAAALNMLLDLFQLPKENWAIGENGRGNGIFTTGATASNVLGLALGREWILSKAAERATGKAMSVGENGLHEVMMAAGINKIQVLSTMPHSSIAKAASIVGIGRANVISITKPGSALAIDLDRLRREASKPNTATILAISSGEVNTGRFATNSSEQMKAIRAICDQHKVWVHVDGAFGLFGRVLRGCDNRSEYKEITEGCEGLEFADSITGDGHKLLNVPYDCGFFFTRHSGLSEEVFRNGNAAYLSTGAASGDGIVSPLNIGIENSRRFRALPVYATLITYGRQGYIDMLQRQIGLARRIAGWLFDHPEFELLPRSEDRQGMMEKTFIVVLFRAVDKERNGELVKRINKTGKIYVSGTQWDGRPAARIAVSNWQADIDRDGNIIEQVLSDVVA